MPNSHEIKITAAALTHIRAQLEQTQAHYLRLGVKESGCNGYMYMLDYLEAPGANDVCLEFGDEPISVCVSSDHLPMVQGTEVDILTEGLNRALVFKNAKATSYCGCGESFAVGGADAKTDLDPADLATNVGDQS